MQHQTWSPKARSGCRPQCFCSAALVGGYSDVTLPIQVKNLDGQQVPAKLESMSKQRSLACALFMWPSQHQQHVTRLLNHRYSSQTSVFSQQWRMHPTLLGHQYLVAYAHKKDRQAQMFHAPKLVALHAARPEQLAKQGPTWQMKVEVAHRPCMHPQGSKPQLGR
eukprot:1142657-Pelagomonas_calceolata.AAC.2